MAFIYVYEPGTHLNYDTGQIIITPPNKQNARSIPVEQIEGFMLFGRIEITGTVLTTCLERGIPVTWLSHRGKYFGRLASTAHVNIDRQRLQFEREQDYDFRKGIAAKLISSKITGQRLVLQRLSRKSDDKSITDTIQLLSCYSDKARAADSVEQMMGYEGTAAKLYFSAVSGMVPEPFSFSGRSRRPPRDPFNSLLSFAYTLIFYEMFSQLENYGLNPYAGFVHTGRADNPALASDMVEEWRSIFADALVLSLINRNMIKSDQFQTAQNGGVYADKTGSEILIRAYQKKMDSKVKSFSGSDESISYRQAFRVQVRSLIKALDSNNPDLFETVVYH
ncbi:MAG: CRISPR-associated endonuclease Cas1 [Eubacteriaceae bacterium]